MMNDSNTRVFMLPDGITGNSSLVDPNLLLTTVMNNGGFGNNGNWIWIFFLLILFGRNGWGNGFGGDNGNILGTGYLSNQITNTSGRDLLMQAINGNGAAVQQLSTNLGCDINSIKTALNSIQSSICQVGNQVGMSAADVKSAITTGNMSIAQQLAQCCCDNKLLVTTLGYENQLLTLNQTNQLTSAINSVGVGQERGFSAVAYETQALTCALGQNISNGVLSIKDSTNAQTNSILAKLDAIEDDRKNRLITDLTALLTAANSRAERAAELAPITKALSDIQCKQPNVVTVPYSPFTPVPNCVAWNAALYNGGFPYNSGSIWS